MANEPLHPVPPPRPSRLPQMKDPTHLSLVGVENMGLLTLQRVVLVCSALLLAGSLVHLRVPVQDGDMMLMKTVSLNRYVADRLGLWPLGDPSE